MTPNIESFDRFNRIISSLYILNNLLYKSNAVNIECSFACFANGQRT